MKWQQLNRSCECHGSSSFGFGHHGRLYFGYVEAGAKARPLNLCRTDQPADQRQKAIAKTQGINRTAIETLRDSSAIGLHFMKAGENKQPRASLEETKQAYQESEDAGLKA